MKLKAFGIVSVVLLGFPLIASAADSGCPEAASKILSSYGVADGVNQPKATTDLSNLTYAQTGMAYQLYQDSGRKIKIEVTEKAKDGGWSAVTVKQGSSEISSSRVGSVAAEPSAKTLGLSYNAQCKLSTVQAEIPMGDQHIIEQASCSAKFCQDMNAGKPLQKFRASVGGEYLQFGDGSGNIASAREAVTRQMCTELAPFLTSIEDTSNVPVEVSNSPSQTGSTAAAAQ